MLGSRTLIRVSTMVKGLAMTRDEVDFIASYRSMGRFISTPGRSIFLVDQGSGPPVLFLHGIPTYSYLWRDVTPQVALNHRTLAPDLPGFGLSEKRREWDYSVQAQADTVRSLLVQLNVERVAIVCHDFGALVAAELIAREPALCTHLIVLNTSLRSKSWSGDVSPLSLLGVPVLGELALAFSRKWMLEQAMRIYVDRKNRLTSEVMRHYWWPFRHGYCQTLLNMSRSRAATESDFERWRTALGRLAVPCLIIWGAADPTFTPAEARDLECLIPAARLQVFDHANHFVPEDRPLAAGRLINAFLAGLP